MDKGEVRCIGAILFWVGWETVKTVNPSLVHRLEIRAAYSSNNNINNSLYPLPCPLFFCGAPPNHKAIYSAFPAFLPRLHVEKLVWRSFHCCKRLSACRWHTSEPGRKALVSSSSTRPRSFVLARISVACDSACQVYTMTEKRHVRQAVAFSISELHLQSYHYHILSRSSLKRSSRLAPYWVLIVWWNDEFYCTSFAST